MSRKAPTVNLKGKDYAQVADRVKIFREDCPHGLIETLPPEVNDKNIIIGVRVLKNKADPDSGESTQYAMGKAGGTKEIERLQTVATGRALAMVGYAASGEIASAEEMEEFYEYQEQKMQDAMDLLNESKTIEELKENFIGLGPLIAEKAIIAAKDARKKELLNENS